MTRDKFVETLPHAFREILREKIVVSQVMAVIL